MRPRCADAIPPGICDRRSRPRLQRLQVEQIDLLQLHCWIAAGTRELDWLETLNELRLEGKIAHIGVSIRDYRPDDGIGLARLGLVEFDAGGVQPVRATARQRTVWSG